MNKLEGKPQLLTFWCLQRCCLFISAWAKFTSPEVW